MTISSSPCTTFSNSWLSCTLAAVSVTCRISVWVSPAKLVPDPAAARKQLKLLYLSCGNKEGLINISQGVHRYLKEQDVPHVWNVDDQPHDRGTWANNLFHFAQRLFR
jgi:hypothetical protein